MSISMIEFLRGKSFNRMDPSPYNQDTITTVIVRRIDLKIAGSDLRIFFSKSRRINLNDYDDDFTTILTKLCRNTFRFNSRPPKLERPYDSDLSLNNDSLSLIVYQLSSKNFQFGSRGWPITVADKGYGKKAYFDAKRVFFRQGKIYSDNGDSGDPVIDGCKVAFFIADHMKANTEFTGNYSDAINFHIEFYYDDDDKNRRYIPIIIDPDIRYPGGSVEP